MKAEKESEKTEEWKPTGRKLEGKELQEWKDGLNGITDSIKALYKENKNGK